MSVHVRWMGPDDAEAYGRMAHALWDRMSPQEHVDDNALGFTDNPKRRSAIAFLNGEEVGFGDLGFRPHVDGAVGRPVGHLEGIWVEERYRGQGVARAIVAFFEDAIRARGLSEMTSDALIENEASARAHARWGFREHARIIQFHKVL